MTEGNMNDEQREAELLVRYEDKLAHYELEKDQIIEIRQAVKRMAGRILDKFFDPGADL